MRLIYLIPLMVIFLLCVSGCQPTVIPHDQTPGANQVQDTAPVFFSLENDQLNFAAVNVPFNHAYCDDVDDPSDICGADNEFIGNPSGGNPPFHLQLDTGIGFPPMGLILHPNGFLDGTPSIVGAKNFSICAVDQSSMQQCQYTTINVIDLKVTLDSVSCFTEDKTVEIGGSIGTVRYYKITAKGTATGPQGAVFSLDPNYNHYLEEDPNANMYLMSISEKSDCGTWIASNTMIPDCTNNAGGDTVSTTSWTIIYELSSNMYPMYNGPIVSVGLNVPGDRIKTLDDKSKAVTCI